MSYLGPLTIGTGPDATYRLMRFETRKRDDGRLDGDLDITTQAATPVALAAAVEALAAQLRGMPNTFAHAASGLTNLVVYTVEELSDLQLVDPQQWKIGLARVKATVILSRSPAGALQTPYSAQHLDTPGALDLSTLLGTHPPRLDLTIDDDSGNDMHSVICALVSKVLTDDQTIALSRAHWLVLAASLTWATMIAGTGATWWGNSNRYTTSASWQTAPLDTSGYPEGCHKVFARVQQSAGAGYIKLAGGAEIAVTRATPHLVELGDVYLPIQGSAAGVVANLIFSCRSDGTNTLTVGGFLVLPHKPGLFVWHHALASGEIDQLDVGPSGVFMDGLTDYTYLVPGAVLEPDVLAVHTPTLISPAQPIGNDFPVAWGKTDGNCTADTNRFKIVGASKYVWFAATVVTTPLAAHGEWYELLSTRDVDSWVAGNVTAQIVWQDIDGGTIRTDTLSSVAANDGAPVPLELYAKCPPMAARALAKFGHDGTGNVTSYWSAVSLRRCPLRLAVVAEDSLGTLVANKHPVHATLKYLPRYEGSR